MEGGWGGRLFLEVELVAKGQPKLKVANLKKMLLVGVKKESYGI